MSLDSNKTYLVWNGAEFPNSTGAEFKAPAGSTIDWGDGTVETFATASTTVNTHTYTDGKTEHTIAISGLTNIFYRAFNGCSSLTSVTIGNSVTSIGSYAFNVCSSLKQLILFPSTPPTLGSGAIPSTIQSIYVQQSPKAAYQAATNWTAFANKIIGDNIYLSFVRFNQKNKEYIEKKINNLNASLAKADSSLQKPTTTLAKESFVKVGTDGTEKFDENSYVIAPSTDGTVGQVLKKTATGTEWANESGGGGGGADTLEAKLNENIVKDPSKTYLVWKGSQFPNSTNATFKAPAGCTIDWGDGNVETFETASTVVNTHTYTDGIEYHLISLSNNVKTIPNYAFKGCRGLTSVTIGTSVTSIGDYAFEGCGRLTSVTIPDSVTSIGYGMFINCYSLTSITIPDSVTSIGSYVFASCSRLKTIRISATNPPTLGSDVFYTSLEKIIVPKSAINAYKTAAGWSQYADKIVYEVDSSDLGNVEVDNRTITKTSNEEIQAVALTNGTDLLTYAEILQATIIERL